MVKFHIVVAKCDRYEIEADNQAEALSRVKADWYKESRREFREKYDDQLVDSFVRFDSEGEFLDERDVLLQDVLGRLKELGKPQQGSSFDDYDIDDLAKLYDELSAEATTSLAEGTA